MRITEPCGGTGRRGVALGSAVFALAIMGGLVAGNFMAGWLEHQSGRNTLFAVQAAEAAEAELWEAATVAPRGALEALVPGGAGHQLAEALFNGVVVQREVVRLTERVFLIRTRASRTDASGTPLATRTLGLLVKLAADSASPAALVPLAQRPWVQLY